MTENEVVKNIALHLIKKEKYEISLLSLPYDEGREFLSNNGISEEVIAKITFNSKYPAVDIIANQKSEAGEIEKTIQIAAKGASPSGSVPYNIYSNLGQLLSMNINETASSYEKAASPSLCFAVAFPLNWIGEIAKKLKNEEGILNPLVKSLISGCKAECIELLFYFVENDDNGVKVSRISWEQLFSVNFQTQ